MTTTTVSERATRRAWPTSRLARSAPQTAIFSAAIAVALLHALDDAFLHRGPGVGLGQHVMAAVGLARARRSARSTPSRTCGPRRARRWPSSSARSRSSTAPCMSSTSPPSGMAASDLTGVLALAAGIVLVGLAACDPVRHRGEGTAGRGGAGRTASLAVPAGLLLALFTVVPIGTAIIETHKFRERIGAPPGADYREVAFDASTASTSPAGTARRATARRSSCSTAAAATAPARSPTPSCSSATATASCSTTPAAAARAKAPRTPSAGAGRRTSPARCAFLNDRPEVDAARIGGLGLSTGADAMMQAAGAGHEPPRRRRGRNGCGVVRGLAPPAGHHGHDADLRRRVRDRQDHLGGEVGAADART